MFALLYIPYICHSLIFGTGLSNLAPWLYLKCVAQADIHKGMLFLWDFQNLCFPSLFQKISSAEILLI